MVKWNNLLVHKKSSNKKGKMMSFCLTSVLSLAMVLSGCGNNSVSGSGDEYEEVEINESVDTADESVAENDFSAKPDTDQFIELALNVYYNDGDHGYFNNESGPSIYVTEDGSYEVTFDCASDLSDEAKGMGVRSLTNLTAIYLLDMGAGVGAQSPLTACNIMYDEITVDGVDLTITQDEPKSAFKSSGIFDTNDPINAWDGSKVEEVISTSDHIANFTTVTNPTTITVTFTLSDMVWGEQESEKVVIISDNDYVNTMNYDDVDFASMDSVTLTKYLGNGINLGNTFEAYGHSTLGAGAPVSAYETYWGQPITTEEMIKGMKNCGFDTIRIPVSWTNKMDYENGDYTIDSSYLDRVEEVVNYALDNDMFVLINDHWDGAWWGKFGSASESTREEAWTMYTSIWSQVADRFADYSDMVIFESANEELGDGLNANTLCADSGNLSKDECYSLMNEINQKFVDLVRASGGNNNNRFLLIAGYNTDIDFTCDSRFKMPKDSAKDKLLLSVHYYTPWNYCGAEKQSNWGIQKDYDLMEEQLAKMESYKEAGYGIIIGEYAAIPIYQSDSNSFEKKEDTEVFTEYFLDLCDVYNYCPVLWSRNDMYNKENLTMIEDTVTAIYTARCLAEEMKAGEDAYLANVYAHMENAKAEAPEMWEGVTTYEPGTPVAWIMWNGGAGTYSVGDVYNPADNTPGIIAHDTIVDGAGDYTVSLEFEGVNDGLTFAALGIADCELLYPGAIIDIKEILINGEPVKLAGLPYTSSDDGICTRVNLCNIWVNSLPDDARNRQNNLNMATPVILKSTDAVGIKDITINFTLIVPEE